MIERVSTLELFFDLVFVFTITQLTAAIGEDPTWRGGLRAAVMLAVIFWMYGGYAWLTNAVAADTTTRRVVLLAGMTGFFVLALAVPHAFDGGGLIFALAYCVVVAVHIGLFSRASSVFGFGGIFALGRRNGFMVLIVIAGGVLGGDRQLALWAAAAVFAWIVTTYTGTPAAFRLGASHFVERHGLVVLVTIGESVVAIGSGLSDRTVDPSLVAVAILGLGLSTCLWWAYFSNGDARAEHALLRASPTHRSMMAIEGYGHAHLPILLGIIALAAAEESAAHHPFDPLHSGLAVSLGAGAACFLAGDAWFRQRLRILNPRPRLAAAVPALATIPLGVGVAAIAQLAALVGIFLALFVVEAHAHLDRSHTDNPVSGLGG